jgi:hypothetical protein
VKNKQYLKGKKMNDLTMNPESVSRWDSRFFIIAGSFMLINTVLLWVRYYSNYQLSILWPAIPAITGLASSVFALLKLYPRVAAIAPLIAKIGAGFVLLALGSLGVAALWIFVVSVFGEGMSGQPNQGIIILIATFMVTMVLAFLNNAIAFLVFSTQKKIGYLLTVPLAMWFIMLTVGAIKGMERGLSLDYYTNAFIGIAFLALGFTLKAIRNSEN